MSAGRKSEWTEALVRADEAWHTWIKNESIYDFAEAVRRVYAQAYYMGIQRGKEIERDKSQG